MNTAIVMILSFIYSLLVFALYIVWRVLHGDMDEFIMDIISANVAGLAFGLIVIAIFREGK